MLLEQMTAHLSKLQDISKPKAIRHHKPDIEGLHEKLLTLTQGKDAAQIPRLTNPTLMQLLSEIGLDMSPWP